MYRCTECVPVVKRVAITFKTIADEILGEDIFRMLVVVLDTTDGDTYVTGSSAPVVTVIYYK